VKNTRLMTKYSTRKDIIRVCAERIIVIVDAVVVYRKRRLTDHPALASFYCGWLALSQTNIGNT
jgi:hypothetical protein